MVSLDIRAYTARDRISRRANAHLGIGAFEEGLVCLDVRAHRARDSMSWRAKAHLERPSHELIGGYIGGYIGG